MSHPPTPTMNSLDAMFQEIFGPKLLPDIAAPVLPELTDSEIADGDECAERR